ncbi:ATP-binding cassette domain-containing protein [Periweissella cryptocerci]|uniref:ATP-binding cassette domain-containing protein n=1 Tax=Periweissella cryptocerci TaxID=2506420 RepID=UPI001FAA02E9|nr:ATP-binding cassette domain-containing protein [Periweissella cryptocerci]
MDILVGLNQFDRGNVIIDENVMTIPYSKEMRKTIFLLPVESITIEYLTALENMDYFKHIFELNKSGDEIVQILQAYKLEQESGLVKGFSTGMRKRLDLAILDMISPDIMLLDEPSLGLDVFHVDFLRKRLLAYKELGKTLIITSHDMALSNRIADRIYLFNNNQIIEYDADDVNSEEMVLSTYDADTATDSDATDGE